jgi:hypothetical protein
LTWPNRRRRDLVASFSGAGSVATLLLVVIVMAVPTTAVSPVRPALLLLPPFSGISVDLDSWGLGFHHTGVANAFNNTSGEGVVNFQAGGARRGEAVQEVALTIGNVTPSQSRLYNVSVVWRFSYEAALHRGANITGIVFATLNYTSNGSQVSQGGNGTSEHFFVRHVVLNNSGWTGTMDRGVFRLNFTVSLVGGTSYYLLTGYLIELNLGRPGNHFSDGAFFGMGGQGDDRSQLVSVSVT